MRKYTTKFIKMIVANINNKKILEHIINKIYGEGYEDGVNCVEHLVKERR